MFPMLETTVPLIKEKCSLPQSSGNLPCCHCYHEAAASAAGTVLPGEGKKENIQGIVSAASSRYTFSFLLLGQEKKFIL